MSGTPSDGHTESLLAKGPACLGKIFLESPFGCDDKSYYSKGNDRYALKLATKVMVLTWTFDRFHYVYLRIST